MHIINPDLFLFHDYKWDIKAKQILKVIVVKYNSSLLEISLWIIKYDINLFIDYIFFL